MGAAFAADLAGSGLDLGLALEIHLRSNHFPPVPTTMIPACKAAIAAGDEGEDWDLLIDLPEGISYQGKSQAPAWAIIEAHHLECFLGAQDPEED